MRNRFLKLVRLTLLIGALGLYQNSFGQTNLDPQLTAYQIAPKVFHELGAEVVAIGCAPDGFNINHEVGATHPQALRHEMNLRPRAPPSGGAGRPGAAP